MRRLETVVNVIAGVAVLGLLGNTIADVGLRYLANSPLRGTNELVSYWWMPTIAVLGFYVAENMSEHIDVPMVYERLSPASQLVLTVVARIVSIVFCGAVAIFATRQALEAQRVGEYAGADEIPIWPARIVFAIGMYLFVLALVLRLWVEWRDRKPQPSETEQLTEDSLALLQ